MKKLLCLFLTIVCCLCMVACDTCSACEKKGGYTHPEYQSKYTEEEHIERISARTREKYAEEIEEGIIIDFKVEILYAFYDNDPEYFLIEYRFADTILEYKGEGSEVKLTKKHYGHTIGMIKNDAYCVGSFHCCIDENDGIGSQTGYDDEIFVGQNCYTRCGFENAKKYYGGDVFAVEIDGQMVQIYKHDYWHKDEEKCWERRVISESEQKNLMKSSYHMRHIYL